MEPAGVVSRPVHPRGLFKALVPDDLPARISTADDVWTPSSFPLERLLCYYNYSRARDFEGTANNLPTRREACKSLVLASIRCGYRAKSVE